MCLVGAWGTWLAASTQPILLRIFLTAKCSADTVLASLTVRFARPSFSLGPGFVACCNIRNGASSGMAWALEEIKSFRFKLLIFSVSHPVNTTATSVKPLPPNTAVTASLYTTSSILAASYRLVLMWRLAQSSRLLTVIKHNIIHVQSDTNVLHFIVILLLATGFGLNGHFQANIYKKKT